MIAKHVFYAGRVQGVGFRYGTKQIATGFDVLGWVRNLPDSRVELMVKGDEDEVVDFLLEIRENSNLSHHIQEYQEADISLEDMGEICGFTIRS